MKLAGWIGLVALLALTGCTKSSTESSGTSPAPVASSPEFDRQWAQLSKASVDPFYIEDDRAAGLMGKVSRSAGVTPEAAPAPTGLNPLPEKLDLGQISRTIRGNLTAVKICYLKEQRHSPRSGKAIVTFDINTDGKVGEVKVDAPSFEGSDLPGCVGSQVKRLEFPKFQKGPMTVSYPFVFVGS